MTPAQRVNPSLNKLLQLHILHSVSPSHRDDPGTTVVKIKSCIKNGAGSRTNLEYNSVDLVIRSMTVSSILTTWPVNTLEVSNSGITIRRNATLLGNNPTSLCAFSLALEQAKSRRTTSISCGRGVDHCWGEMSRQGLHKSTASQRTRKVLKRQKIATCKISYIP